MAAEVREELSWLGAVADGGFRAVKSVPEKKAGAFDGSEEIGDTWKRRPFDVLVENGGRPGGVRAPLDLSDFEAPVHFVGYPDQHPVPLEVSDGVGEGPIWHWKGEGIGRD